MIGDAITAHEGIRMISFTDSTAVGKHIMSRGSDTMKRVTLELGGKGPLIVLDDGDVDKAVALTAKFGLYHAGQSCLRP